MAVDESPESKPVTERSEHQTVVYVVAGILGAFSLVCIVWFTVRVQKRFRYDDSRPLPLKMLFESNVLLSSDEQAEEEQIHGLGHGSPHRALHQESHHRTASVRQRNARAFGQLMVQLSVRLLVASFWRNV